MRATGIVRRIDDLGRVVIPKEIRRTLRIREGDPLEIYTDREGEIVLKKYSPIGELGQFAESLAKTTGQLVCITDRDRVIAASGSGKREFEGKAISKQLERVIEERGSFLADHGDDKFVRVVQDDNVDYSAQMISTIISEGDAIGTVVICEKDEKNPIGEAENKLAVTAAGFLGRQMEQ